MARKPSILVGIDFSPSSWAAAKQGVAIAERLGAELVLCHSWNPAGWPGSPELGVDGDPGWLNDLLEAARGRLEQWSKDLAASGVVCRERLEHGPASSRLVELIEELRPELAIVGRRGHARLAHVLLGSVSERVVHRSSVPVLVVPADCAEHEVPERLLVGVDFSPGSRGALETARDLAGRLGTDCEIVAAHCEPTADDLGLLSGSNIATGLQWPHDLDDLERWIGTSRGSHPVSVELATGRAERTLVELARRLACDWIVVGFQGRTALAAFLVGSTTDRVLRLTDRPVLVVPLNELSPGEPT